MKTYSINFYTPADWAMTTIKAKTLDKALVEARRIADDDTGSLNFQSYDGESDIELIEVWDERRKTVAVWQSDARKLRLAGRDLLDALENAAELIEANLVTNEVSVEGWKDQLAECLAAVAKAKGGAK